MVHKIELKSKKDFLAGYTKKNSNDLLVDTIYENIFKYKKDFEYSFITSSFSSRPLNIEGRTYNGYNRSSLLFCTMKNDYTVPIFLTFLQAKNNNLYINKGEHGYPVYYYSRVNKVDNNNFDTSDSVNTKDETNVKIISRPFYKVYTVFNMDQIQDCEKKDFLISSIQDIDKNNVDFNFDKIKSVSEYSISDIFSYCSSHNIEIRERLYFKNPYITRSLDSVIPVINMPSRDLYKNESLYLHDFFHELSHYIHFTEVEPDLHKNNINNNHLKAIKEVVAEVSATLIYSNLNLHFSKTMEPVDISEHIENSNGYLYGWIGEGQLTTEEIKSCISKGINVSDSICKNILINSNKISNEIFRVQENENVNSIKI